MRVGSILMRNVGPAIRCDCVRVNYKTNGFFDDHEPYATMSKFRTVPSLGVLFSNYYQCELLIDNQSYSDALPAKLGFPSFEDAIKKNPLLKFPHDDYTYVRIYKEDPLFIRVVKEPKWIPELRQRNISKS